MKTVIFYVNHDGKTFTHSELEIILDVVIIWLHVDLYSLFDTIKEVPIDHVIFLEEVLSEDQKEVHDMIVKLSQKYHQHIPEVTVSYSTQIRSSFSFREIC